MCAPANEHYKSTRALAALEFQDEFSRRVKMTPSRCGFILHFTSNLLYSIGKSPFWPRLKFASGVSFVAPGMSMPYIAPEPA